MVLKTLDVKGKYRAYEMDKDFVMMFLEDPEIAKSWVETPIESQEITFERNNVFCGESISLNHDKICQMQLNYLNP